MHAQARILRKKCGESVDLKQDTPEDADTYSLEVIEGDLLLVMTDGKEESHRRQR